MQWRWSVALVCALALSAVQGRAEVEMGIQAVAAVVSVYDGDTFRVEADIWPGLVWLGSVRVDGVDTPEIRGKCDEEKRLAIEARDFVAGIVDPGVLLTGVHKGKYAGRVVAHVQLDDGRDLTDVLIAEGHGCPYPGTGPRENWCDGSACMVRD